jgi:YhcH/YjgK/YiaL family protein
MIIDIIKNWNVYFKDDWAKLAFDFLDTISEETLDGEYSLMDNGKLFCKVLSYNTKNEDWITESHKEYTDIQILLRGEEIINLFEASTLEVKDDYDSEIDCIFYNLPIKKPSVSMLLIPGIIGVFHPQDAHTTQIAPNNNIQNIRKVVFKVHQSLF